MTQLSPTGRLAIVGAAVASAIAIYVGWVGLEEGEAPVGRRVLTWLAVGGGAVGLVCSLVSLALFSLSSKRGR